jgi:DNA helicase-2/ATP-dependent DNA helicase PcrA
MTCVTQLQALIMKKILSNLNAAQRDAVTFGIGNKFHRLPPPLLILAGAGTGKTSVLAHRVAYLVANGIDPSRILTLVFGNNAAKQMRDRTQVILREAGLHSKGNLEWAGTFHGVGARIVREYARQVGLRKNFTIIDPSDAVGLLKRVAQELPLRIRKQLPNLAVCLKIYSRKAARCCKLSVVLARHFPALVGKRAVLRTLLKGYEDAKLASNIVDFDDLLRLWLVLLRDQKIGRKIRRRFDHVLVDEFQDTNGLQDEILRALKPDGRGLTVVGDDAQSIYSFRGAEISNILDFAGTSKSAVKVIKLEQNYRSRRPILDLCNAVMARPEDDLSKTLWSKRKGKQKPQLRRILDGRAQAQHVADGIEQARARGVPLREQAVLFRNADHSAELEVELIRRGIPFIKRGGPKFLEQAHIKDVLGVLKWLENPRDRLSALRVLDLLPGVGQVAANAIFGQIDGRLTPSRLKRVSVPTSATPLWNDLRRLLGRRKMLKWPNDLDMACSGLLTRSGCKAHGADFVTLQTIASQFKSRREFLVGSVLDLAEIALGEGGDDRLTLSIVHSAKGLEWERVTILSAVDGHFPSMRAKDRSGAEEERRVFYVALSRAKDDLEILVPSRIHVPKGAGKHHEVYLSLKTTPFIAALDARKYLKLAEQYTAPPCRHGRQVRKAEKQYL